MTSLADLDLTRCLACRRTYRAGSKPKWAFHPTGRIAGSIHASETCQKRWRDLGGLNTTPLSVSHYLPEAAMFYAWRWTLCERPERESASWQARFLVEDENITETLSAQQEERLAWWHDGPLKLSDERIAGIREAYRRLIGDFRAWQQVIRA